MNTRDANEENNLTKVLIAHTAKDRRAAENLQDQLSPFGGSRLECLLWEENKQNRLEDLKNRIYETDLLLLLIASEFVDHEDWNWLQWAIAMSWSMSNGHVSRILLHNTSIKIPQCIKVAIEHSFKSENDEIKEFLKYFFGSTEFTQDKKGLNKNLIRQNNQLKALSEAISPLFERNQAIVEFKQATFPKVITLIVENPDGLTKENLSQEICIQSQNSGSLEIFGLADTPPRGKTSWSWKDIIDYLPMGNSQKWVEELEESIYLAHSGRTIPRRVQSTFRSSDGRLFKPILYSRENWTDKSERFTIIFVEHISEGWVYNAPNISLATLLTALILGSRLQWEVCNNYLPQIDRWQREGIEAIQKALQQVKNSFENIEEDAKIRSQGEAPGQRNEDRLRDSFKSEDEKQIIASNLLEQEKYKQTLRSADTQNNVNEVRIALTELSRLNGIVTAMVARRYSQLLNENFS